MSFTADTIFISYSRSDGRDFAEAFERRLAAEGIHSWRDLKNMSAGDIRPQVLRTIEGAKHLVLILSRRALVSDWIKREWSHARLMGKRVSPVLADPTLTRADLPPWMRREEVFDIDHARDRDAERWKALVLTLRGDGQVKPVHYVQPDLSRPFVQRPVEYQALKNAVLAEVPKRTVGLTTALRGAGGYGKTTLAYALCQDDDVRFEFSDGILRVEIGKDRVDVTGLIDNVVQKLDPKGNRSSSADVRAASDSLGEILGESRILLVIDDVWREAQLRPFLSGGPNCVRLVTTRLPGVLPPDHVPVRIDEMRVAEAARLIGVNLPGAEQPANAARLAALSSRLGNWAQMLAIANGWLRERVEQGENLAEAIVRFESRLARKGPFAFDPADKTERDKALRLCIEVSITDLDAGRAARFAELAVLPEDEDVPLDVIEGLWAETGGFDEDAAEDLVRWLDRHSLLQSLDLGRRTLRLHDNILWYLRDRLGEDGLKAAHAAMVRALQPKGGRPYSELPASQTYGWQFLIVHLRGAGEGWMADELLSDYGWIKAKLLATDARSLYRSYLLESADLEVGLIGQAIALSLPALTADKRELALQVFGRLGETSLPCAVAARLDPDFHPRPRWPGLTPPGAERLCLRGQHYGMYTARFSPDGSRIVTACYDNTACIWDSTTGAEVVTLRGHDRGVMTAEFSPDAAHVVTASHDRTARIWDASTGAEIVVLRGHDDFVTSAAFSPDGTLIVTASVERVACIWNAATAAEIVTLHGHGGRVVNSAGFAPDGTRVVTASDDGTARLWEADTGAEIIAFRGHDNEVTSAGFSPDGTRIVTASHDHTACIWDVATGAKLVILRAHDHWVRGAAFSPDGTRIVTASNDHTARIWDAATGAEIAALRGHEASVTGASFSPEGDRIVTVAADQTARVWDASPKGATVPLRGHERSVNSTWFSPDGARVVTASNDGTARIWYASTGAEIVALRGHDNKVTSAAFAPDGARIVTASWDKTACIWDVATDTEIVQLRGHETWVESAAFSPDGARIATASADDTARIWDAVTGGEIISLRGHEQWVMSVAFSPDGARVVTASYDGTARIWDVATGAEIFALRGHADRLNSASFSPDGARVVTASHDRTARIWDAATGAEIVVLRGHDGWVSSAAFSPDGARIVTASDDRTARIWDAATGAEIAHVTLDAAVTGLSIHGTAIALGDALGRIHVFDAEDFLG